MTNDSEGRRQPTVLCVDDDEYVLRSLERSLRRLGCRVLLAPSGSDALELLEQEHVDVLISDEAMPGLNGTEVLRLAKQISPATVRILLTAHCNHSEVVIPAINEGRIFRLLAKPWDNDEIRRIVYEALNMGGTECESNCPAEEHRPATHAVARLGRGSDADPEATRSEGGPHSTTATRPAAPENSGD